MEDEKLLLLLLWHVVEVVNLCKISPRITIHHKICEWQSSEKTTHRHSHTTAGVCSSFDFRDYLRGLGIIRNCLEPPLRSSRGVLLVLTGKCGLVVVSSLPCCACH